MKALSTYAYLAAALTVLVYWTQRDAFDADSAVWIAALVATLLAAVGKASDTLRRRRRQHRREEKAQALFEQLDGDTRVTDYVLYLRPFSTTGRLAVSNPKRRWLPLLPGYYEHQGTLEFESLLSQALPPALPLVALGRPGEHIGAGRIRVDDADWRDAFERLVAQAAWIVMIPSHEGETRWEVTRLISDGHLDKTVFLMPPQPPPAKGIDLPVYWSTMREELSALGLEVPRYNPAGLFFRIGPAGRPTRARYVPRLETAQLHDAFAGITMD